MIQETPDQLVHLGFVAHRDLKAPKVGLAGLDRRVLPVKLALMELLALQDKLAQLDSLVEQVIPVHLVTRVDLALKARLVLQETRDQVDHQVQLVLSDNAALRVLVV